jgi:hypothetical protein
MNDAQILTIALASVPTMLAVLVGILINNARLSDLRSYMTPASTRLTAVLTA